MSKLPIYITIVLFIINLLSMVYFWKMHSMKFVDFITSKPGENILLMVFVTS